jgi:hypothetical protein
MVIAIFWYQYCLLSAFITGNKLPASFKRRKIDFKKIQLFRRKKKLLEVMDKDKHT